MVLFLLFNVKNIKSINVYQTKNNFRSSAMDWQPDQDAFIDLKMFIEDE